MQFDSAPSLYVLFHMDPGKDPQSAVASAPPEDRVLWGLGSSMLRTKWFDVSFARIRYSNNTGPQS